MTGDPPSRALTPFQERLGRLAVQWMAGANLVAYRLSGGRAAARVPGGAPICLVTTTGRRTGRPRTVPLLARRDGDNIVVVASQGGMGTHPAWYLNLRADPRVTVELGRERLAAVARPATATERARLWPALVATYPRFAAYQRRTDRTIPVVILDPVRPGGARRPGAPRSRGGA